MLKENSTFDVSELTLEEKQIRQKDIDVIFETLKETKIEFTKEQCVLLYDHMQQGAVETGNSEWLYYQQSNLN
jgi:hypothetical protein